MKNLTSITVLWVFGLIAGPLWADVIGSRTSATPIQVGAGAALCAPVTNIQVVPFVTLHDNQRVVITFSAECSVKAPDTSTWLNIDILVDGVEISPTQTTDNAFCTSRGNNVLDGWVSAATTGVYVVPDPGLHTALVRGSLIGCSDVTDDQWRIDDMATIIMK